MSSTVNLALLDLQMEEEADEELAMAVAAVYARKRTKRWWVHPINQSRKSFGAYYSLIPQLRMHHDRYQEYLRVDIQQFSDIHRRIAPLISKKDSKFRECISTDERLTICLR